MKDMKDLIDGRCGWCTSDDIYINYHDNEWGKLVTDDKTLFEFLILEGAQAGLSWLTILRKREGYRQAFHNFDVAKVARMTDEDIELLMKFDGIIKNRLKISSAINNARLFIGNIFRVWCNEQRHDICYAHLQATGFVNDHLVGCNYRETWLAKKSESGSWISGVWLNVYKFVYLHLNLYYWWKLKYISDSENIRVICSGVPILSNYQTLIKIRVHSL